MSDFVDEHIARFKMNLGEFAATSALFFTTAVAVEFLLKMHWLLVG